eukprot:1689262-Pyramimonas_sp.AAC.1
MACLGFGCALRGRARCDVRFFRDAVKVPCALRRAGFVVKAQRTEAYLGSDLGNGRARARSTRRA